MGMTLRIGQVLQGRYRIDDLLGKGGMGAVYRAHDLRLNCIVAIKENLEFDQEALLETEPAPGRESSEGTDARRSQFEREAQILARMRHQGLPKVTDHFLVPGQGQYLVMEFVHGKDLSEIIAERGCLEVDDAIRISIDVCRVLEYLHAQQPSIIHRDLKPANLRLTPDGRLIVVDFGIAKEGASGLTRTGALGVTPGFSPVEQYAGSGKSDARSDVYALGATLYALLSGKAPPAATDRFVGAPVVPLNEKLAGAGTRVQTVIDRAMALNPDDRYASATHLREALEQVVAGTGSVEDTLPPGAGLTAPIVPVRDSGVASSTGARQSDPGKQRKRRSFFDTAETEPAAPRSPEMAPVATERADRRASMVDPAPGVREPQEPSKRGRHLAMAALILLILGVSGYSAYRFWYLPRPIPGTEASEGETPALLWSSIEVHVSDPETRPSNATLLERIDAKSSPVRSHAATALLSDRELASRTFDGDELEELVRSLATGLDCGKEYRAVAVATREDGSPERLGSALFLSDPCSGSAPERLTAVDIGPEALTLRWDWEGQGFVAYEVHHSQDAVLSPSPLTRTGDALGEVESQEQRVTGLECDTEYTFLVRVIMDSGATDSTPLRVRTAPCPSAEIPDPTPSIPREPPPTPVPPAAPNALQVSGAAAGSVDLTWSWEGPGFQSYDLYCSRNRDFMPGPSTHAAGPVTARDRMSAKLTGLDCGTRYFARVRVVSSTGMSDSEPYEFRTADCATVSSSTGSATPSTPSTTPDSPPVLAPVHLDPPIARSGTAVELRWSRSPSALFSGYDIHLSVSPAFVPSPSTKVQTVSMVDQSTLQLADLACNTTYYFRVVVRDIKAQSAISDLASVTTPACAIPNPVHLSPAGGGDFPDLLTAFAKINQDPNVPDGLRIVLAPGTYSFAGDLWLGKSVVLDGPQATLQGRIVLQAPRIELIGLTLETSGKSALNVPSGQLFLKDCTIQSRTHPGIEVLNNGSVEIRNTTIRDCGSKGLLLRGQARALVQGGSIEGNESGVDVGGTAQLTMHGTRVTRSRQSGVYVHDGGNATIDQGAVINSNGLNGILVAAGARLELSDSQVRENQQAGVIVESGGTARLRDCDLTGNAQDALIEDSGSTVAREGQVRTR